MTHFRLPPLKSLLAFRHAAKSLSFKEASEHLNVTQAAISQQIKTLEYTLDMTLFERQTRQVSLTVEGEQLYQYVEQAFDLLEQGVRTIVEDPNPNRLAISTLPSFASRWLVSRIGTFQAIEQSLNLYLIPGLQIASFQDQELDISVRFGQGSYNDLKSELLFEEFLIPICHPSLIDQNLPIKPQLAKLQIIEDSGPDMTATWSVLQQHIVDDTRKLPSHLKVSDATILIEALLSGQGISMIRFSLVYDLIKKGQLISPLPFYMKSTYHFYLVAPPSHFKYEKVQKFRNWLKNEVKEIQTSWEEYRDQTEGLKLIDSTEKH
ncbi:LysR substrate-binding domain-containing protein [Marinomonas mediterranea]|uniref:LysR substrate-binding domain-containing protein n=1 Tax=Marinomonas mediterranea TaxID=119864 RepID=UPI00234AE303|nr:LysR substrate-binding domain-containing protein [Marinomonas mediterranea]WCN11056.1 LysR family transcriptional regulator [Marinomonas mediterranea]